VNGILEELKEMLERVALQYPLLPGLVYRSPYDFVLQHGVEYAGPWDKTMPIGVQKQCYANAITYGVLRDLKYIEGFAVAPDGQVILHGWNAGPRGELIDVTWANTGLCYFGVEFSIERADDATWNGDAHVLNDENRGYPLFQQRWPGENYSLPWPYSDRLECLREHKRTGSKKYTPPPTVVAWLEGRET